MSAITAVNSASNLVKRDELIDSIRADRLVVTAGTGVSLQSVSHPAPGTDVAGWPGLLKHGLNHCRILRVMDEDDAEIVALQIERATTDALIDAAQKIHDCLDKQDNGRYWWMKESVGQLNVADPSLIRAIQGLGGLISTITYDTLVVQVTGRPAVHWHQPTEITNYMRSHSKEFILHLHGLWSAPESVVLDRRSYDAISKDRKIQDLLRRFARFETMLFVGCWQTVFDPNFQTLLSWAHDALLGAEHRHFILCRESEHATMLGALQKYGYLTPLVYGNDYADLTAFLENLARDAGVSATAANPLVSPAASAGTGAKLRSLTPAEVWKHQSQR